MTDTYIVEESRRIVGDIVLWLLIVELVYYIVKLAYVVYQWINNRKVAVKRYRNVWRHYRRTRYESLN